MRRQGITPFAAQGYPVHNLKAPTRSRVKETLQIWIANKMESFYGAARRGSTRSSGRAFYCLGREGEVQGTLNEMTYIKHLIVLSVQ